MIITINEKNINNESDLLINSDDLEQFLQEEKLFNSEKYCIEVNAERISAGGGMGYLKGFLGNPYFKVYDSSSSVSASKNIRISMVDGTLIPSHSDGYGNLNVNRKVKNFITMALVTECSNKKYKGMTVFDAMWEYVTIQSLNSNFPIANKPDVSVVINGVNNI